MAAEYQKNQCYPLRIIGITNEGNGVGKLDGFTVFVPGTVVGDQIVVRLVKVLKHYAFGRVETITGSSPDRIQPDCPVYPKCGGCTLRQMSYQSELTVKEQWVKEAFQRLGGLNPAFLPILGSERAERYRNKAQYPFGQGRDGKILAGFYGARSHRVIDCPDCLLQPQLFGEVLAWVKEFASEKHISVYDEITGTGVLRNLYLRWAEDTGELMVCLVCAVKSLSGEEDLVEGLIRRFPQITGILLNYNPKKTNVILGESYRLLWGKETLRDVMCGVSLEISPASFYQVNHRQAQRLYELAASFAGFQGDELLLDLYCGVGSIGLSMAGRVGRLIGVEVVPQAVENAWENARINGIQNAEFFCGDAKEAAASLEQQGLRPDVVLVDPPRKGCDRELLETIHRMGPDRIVMVSCNPATAARDCAVLGELGYETKQVQAVDLFPRTSHVETVVLMSKVKEKNSEKV